MSRKIFIGGLHWNTTNEGLKAYFEQFGQVVDCNIMRDPTGRSRCFGFVTFADPLAVDIVLQKTHILDKKQIDPKRAIPRDQPHPLPQSSQGSFSKDRPSSVIPSREENKVFVGGIHVEANEEDLKDVMSHFGEVVETILMRDRETGRSRGFGFVTFASHDAALKACEEQDLRIRARRVEVKMAVPKGKQPLTQQRPMMSGGSGVAPYGSSGSFATDPYAAWAEYFKQYPEYYEAMMKAYSNPSAMAAYYSQYYAAAGGAAPHPHASTQAQSPELSAYNSLSASGQYTQSPPSFPPPQDSGTIGESHYYGGAPAPEDSNGRDWQKPDQRSNHRHHHYRSRSRSRGRDAIRGQSPEADLARRRSRSPSRSRSKSPNRSRGRSRSPRDTRTGSREEYHRDYHQSLRHERSYGGSRNEPNTDNNYVQGSHRSPPLSLPSYAPHTGDEERGPYAPEISYRPEDEYPHVNRCGDDNQPDRSHELPLRYDRRRRD